MAKNAKGYGSTTRDPLLTFLSHVDQREINDCWEWQGGKMEKGYGRFTYEGRGRGAHVVSVLLGSRQIPRGHEVAHSCDTRGCVNPSHLSTMTHGQNISDAFARGRKVSGTTLLKRRIAELEAEIEELKNGR